MNAQTETEANETNYDQLSWQKLKALVNAEGREYIDIPTSIKFLTELDGDSVHDVADEANGGNDSGEDDSADDVVSTDDLVNEPVDESADDRDPVFNPDEKHGVITGVSNARYWQNGCHFDSHGAFIPADEV